MLQVDNIHSYYGDSHVLQGVSVNVKKGSLSVLLGRNGMGKTTTIRSIIGFTPPRQGKIRFQGNEIQKLPSYRVAQLGIGLVPQGRGVFPNLTVKENLTIAARNSSRRGWTLDRIYELFPRLKERASSMGGNLSGGEQQMLTIGRALMTNPDLLLLDEPSEGLSPLMVQEVENIISALKQEGLSMLMVEQNISMALHVADWVYVMCKGEVVFDGSPDDLKRNDAVKHKYLGMSS
ncbi:MULTISPECIES: ABC transporter ATP-binding protein [Paenibacillus]|uniref:Amino acid ABC transporter ATPase n=1 Tax=Paenibacillus naphthalenovorans TaxID=162209 RepID=A0A0U2UBQ8_9BACL|nr:MULTISPECIES: ABC transporter ATP-binding protein [Paenibacillus]ALS23689.1 amino acid ABC transporter ATPase [Paenibacillus naphthalenovorans]